MFNILLSLTPSLTRVLITSVVLGFLAGSFGVFIVLKKQALIGDSLAHAALPGIVISFLVFGSKRLEILLIGAFISGIVAIILFNIIKKYSKIKNDATLAIILAGFFGLGRLLLSIVQSSPLGAGAAGLEDFIFGQTATILLKDMYLIVLISVLVNIFVLLLWKEFKLSTFNSEYFNTLGFNSKIVNSIFSILIVLVVVAGIQMIGIVLISSLLIAPAVAARQWSHKLSINFVTAGLLGAVSGLIGVLIGDYYSLPPGPTIIVVLSLIVLVSLLLAPKNGVLAKTIKDLVYKHRIKKYSMLVSIYRKDSANLNIEKVDEFIEDGLLSYHNKQYILTDKGIIKVRQILGVRDNG